MGCSSPHILTRVRLAPTAALPLRAVPTSLLQLKKLSTLLPEESLSVSTKAATQTPSPPLTSIQNRLPRLALHLSYVFSPGTMAAEQSLPFAPLRATLQHMSGEWISRETTMCLVLPTMKALSLATSGKLFTQILSLPTLFALPPSSSVAISKGVVHAVLSLPYLPMAHPGVLLTSQLIKSKIRPLEQLATLVILWNILPRFLLRNYRQEPPRILTRPGTLTILPTPEKSTCAPSLSPIGPIPITGSTISCL